VQDTSEKTGPEEFKERMKHLLFSEGQQKQRNLWEKKGQQPQQKSRGDE